MFLFEGIAELQGGEKNSLSRDLSRKAQDVMGYFLPVPTDSSQHNCYVWILQDVNKCY